MKRFSFVAALVVIAAAGSYAWGASTSKPLVDTYNAVADGILAAKHAEAAVVKAILESHIAHAKAAAAAGKWDDAAAELSLAANEGDNAVGGIRKRLLEGGHHHNAEGEAKGIYEPGYVVVTIAMKKGMLDLVAKLQAAKDDAARKAVWGEVEKAAAAFCPAK
jgi:hypothetical protein